jgi:hypothetical protein
MGETVENERGEVISKTGREIRRENEEWEEATPKRARRSGENNYSIKIILKIWIFRGWPPLWSFGQRSWLQIQSSRVRFPALPHFLSNGVWNGIHSALERINKELLERKSSSSGLEN